MRPPKSVRDRLKSLGKWSVPDSPPPSFPELVEDLGSNPRPLPGSFSPVFNTFQSQQELPSIAISIDSPFYEIAEVIDELLLESDHVREGLRSIGLSVNTFVSRLLGISAVAMAMHLSETASVNQGQRSEWMADAPSLPETLSWYIQTTGEFTGPDGRKWILSERGSQVAALIRLGRDSIMTKDFNIPASKLWLPVCTDDKRTAHIVACKLARWFSVRGFSPGFDTMWGSLFSGNIPPDISASISNMAFPEKAMVTRLFKVYSTDQEFVNLFSDEIGIKTLHDLGLEWDEPRVSDLSFFMDSLATAKWALGTWTRTAYDVQRILGTVFPKAVRHGSVGSRVQSAKFSGDGEIWSLSSFYPLNESMRTEAVVLGSPTLFRELPVKYNSTGFLNSDHVLRSLLVEDFNIR